MQNKYPRTSHFKFSPGATNDDKIIHDIKHLLNIPLVITCKLDGGNACIMKRGVFARSHANKPNHPSFDHMKALHAKIGWSLPDDIMIFGENLFARHSIEYDRLPAFFLVFGILNTTTNMWQSWENVKIFSELLNLHTVPVDYTGSFTTEKELQKTVEHYAKKPSHYGKEREGVVVRNADSFINTDFSKNVVKWVRFQHVQTNAKHWSTDVIVPNKLAI